MVTSVTTDPKITYVSEWSGDVYSDCRMEWLGGFESLVLDFAGQKSYSVATLGTHAWMVQKAMRIDADYGLEIGIAVATFPLLELMS